MAAHSGAYRSDQTRLPPTAAAVRVGYTGEPERGSELKYMPELDGVRAIAILCVLPAHFGVHDTSFGKYLNTGNLGVKLFFVLSGYLIASILLRYRDEIDRGEATLPAMLRTFYMRRFLRLFPVYYAYLCLAAVALRGVRPYLPWFFAYLQNFLFALHPEVFEKYLAHFWTLAIEEQFYLFTPMLLLMLPRRLVVAFVAALVAVGVLFRVVGVVFGFSNAAVNFMTPAQFDPLGMGALLAALRWAHGLEGPAVQLSRWGLRLGLPLGLASLWVEARGELVTAHHIVMNLGLSLFFVWVVASASTGIAGPMGTALRSKPLRFLGKISYGIYVYHFNVPGLLEDMLLPRVGVQLPQSVGLRFVIFALTSVGIATVSWYLFELPINRIKARYRAASTAR